MRTQIVAHLTSALTNAAVKCSSELPWMDGNEPLYMKNMKRLYVDREQKSQSTLIAVLPPAEDVIETEVLVQAYFTVDAKNQPGGLDSAITTIVGAKDISSIVSVVGRECNYETEIQGDVLIYTFTYRFVSIT